jgi:hypothetical protein
LVPKTGGTPYLLLVATWTAMAIYSQRNIPLYAVVTCPILTWIVTNVVRDTPRLASWLNFDTRLASTEAPLRGGLWPVIAVLLVIAALVRGFNLDFTRRGNHFDSAVFPVQAVDWMEGQTVSGPGFNYFPGEVICCSVFGQKRQCSSMVKQISMVSSSLASTNRCSL